MENVKNINFSKDISTPNLQVTEKLSVKGSVQEGHDTQAIGDYSHAEGYGSIANGNYSHAEGIYTRAEGKASHAQGSSYNDINTTASGKAAHAEGQGTIASGEGSHAEGRNSKAVGSLSHAEGNNTETASEASHAEGRQTHALGTASHSEGQSTYANAMYSHAEGVGSNTSVSATGAHAEGSWTQANADYAHAEGSSTIAAAKNSHAEGNGTYATGEDQHVQGRYNITDNSKAHIVGNGTSPSDRKNIHVLDWDGNAFFAGNVYVQATNNNANKTCTSMAVPVATKADLKLPVLWSDVQLLSTPTDIPNNYTAGAIICLERGLYQVQQGNQIIQRPFPSKISFQSSNPGSEAIVLVPQGTDTYAFFKVPQADGFFLLQPSLEDFVARARTAFLHHLFVNAK